MDQYRIYPSTPLVPLVACDNTDDGEIADRCKGEKVAGHAMTPTGTQRNVPSGPLAKQLRGQDHPFKGGLERMLVPPTFFVTMTATPPSTRRCTCVIIVVISPTAIMYYNGIYYFSSVFLPLV
jgi:hypothetical protein